MRSRSPEVAHALNSGRFQDAYHLLRSANPGNLHDQLAVAECLLHLGTWERMGSLLGEIISKGTASQKAKALSLQGELRAYKAEVNDAEDSFRAAVALATTIGDRELSCRIRLRQYTQLGPIKSDTRLKTLANEVHEEALAIGSDAILSMYHVAAAAFEATRDQLGAALAHEHLAAEHLRRQPNCWLQANLATARFGTAFLLSNYGEALSHAEEALRFADDSGDRWSRAAAAANLGVLWLHRGNIGFAEEQLAAARELGSLYPVLNVCILDAWAQLCLMQRKMTEAKEAVGEVLRVIESSPAISNSWYELVTLYTRVRLHRTENDWSAAYSVAQSGLALATSRGDSNAEAWFQCALAESLLATGDRSAASGRFADAMRLTRAAPSVRIERNRIRSLLHETDGEHEIAEDAIRLASELAEDLHDAVALGDVSSRPRRPRRAGVIQEEESSDISLACFMSIADCVDRPTVLASQVLRMLVRERHIKAGAVIQEVGGRSIRILRWNCSEADDLTLDKGFELIPLDESVRLAVLASTGDRARHVLASFRDLIKLLTASKGTHIESADHWTSTSYQVSSASAFTSRAMSTVLATADRIAGVDVTVLLTGETGVGKEVLAKTIHDKSPRANGPFVPFNCSAIPREMLESQLFGYRKGAFTGALEAFSGVVRAAEPGTLFLDEVGDLPLDLQPKLLRFLEASEVHPLGEPRPIRVNVRVIAATNADLTARIKDHQFREDLYYRLNTIQIDIPPLRRRTEEIPQLARTLLAAHAEEFRKGRLQLADGVLERLLAYEWPGNIRELSNEMRRLAALAEPDSVVDTDLLADRILGTSRPPARKVPAADIERVAAGQPLPQAISALEKTMIERALQMSEGKVDEAARMLGISRKGLFLKRKRYGISN